jgi:hypothetical protein
MARATCFSAGLRYSVLSTSSSQEPRCRQDLTKLLTSPTRFYVGSSAAILVSRSTGPLHSAGSHRPAARVLQMMSTQPAQSVPANLLRARFDSRRLLKSSHRAQDYLVLAPSTDSQRCEIAGCELAWLSRAAVTPGSTNSRSERPCAERRSAARRAGALSEGTDVPSLRRQRRRSCASSVPLREITQTCQRRSPQWLEHWASRRSFSCRCTRSVCPGFRCRQC